MKPIRRKKSKTASLAKDVATTNRWGCGCAALILLGIVAAMIISGYLQNKP